MIQTDIVIVGGGIAGASLGAELAGHAEVVILEMEDQAGYHATGRSVAFWEESYGGPAVQPLTTASGPWLARPDPDFHDRPFLSPRGTLHIGRAGDEALRDALLSDFAGKVELARVDPASLVPGLRPEWTLGVLEASCRDIDVAALHQAYLRKFRRLGGTLRLDCPVLAAERVGDGWRGETRQGPLSCRLLVNAAGAWADAVAGACGVDPVGITPLRRTVVQLRVPDMPSPDLPLLMDLGSGFYFKPEGPGRVWLTPHDEVPSPPCDAAPEELDVARAIARFEEAVDWRVAAVERKWAGLRSFAPDRAPVYGFDADMPGFFWFAGQGGFGIQTAPAAALLGAALIRGDAMPDTLCGVDPQRYAPARFRRSRVSP
ncbi:NAD(P)/FAD-dependent oxidoreductase [Sphingobium sp. CCH11-B1]|uniref:NAD(P)/FAD-dependent oxidoreductase n=1 Tax=Sphingobium sp. CCH11-B1 TaxID=1768781 RepID=UPI00082D6EB2|nr:FAD-dependent oxidoreductase [Sphingobium sp. CCH11-B1]MEA3390494.1 FAD-dependent oxidoreductase [Pseudomonadota bacterium]